jgi:hypothetical protein
MFREFGVFIKVLYVADNDRQVTAVNTKIDKIGASNPGVSPAKVILDIPAAEAEMVWCSPG